MNRSQSSTTPVPTPANNPFRTGALPIAVSVALVVSAVFSGVGLLPAARTVSTNPVPMTVDAGGNTALVQVPKNCTSITIDQRAAGPSSQWARFKVIPVKTASAPLKIALPENSAKSEWRATGSFSAPSAGTPDASPVFYRGPGASVAVAPSGRGLQTTGIPASGTKPGNAPAAAPKTPEIPPAPPKIPLPQISAKPAQHPSGNGTLPPAKSRKYPAAFYRGPHTFNAVAAPSYSPQTTGAPAPTATSGTVGAAASLAATASDAATVPPAVEESDIWKADGTTIYFFNQLRGLQVIDIADPANPALRASLRLPASGQDLYVVPGAGTARHAVLLTQSYDQKNYRPLTGVKVVSVDGPTASLVSETTIDGWMADSRLVGNRLYLATQKWAWSTGSPADTTTLNELVVDSSSGTVTEGTSHVVAGSWPVISAGNDWLAVASQDSSDWQTSRITLFQLSNDGAAPLTTSPVTAFGRVFDKYNVQYAGGTLTVISQKWVSAGNSWWNNTPVTELQNFSAAGEVLGSLEIIKGEALNATRFAGNKAYVVTSQRIDPLWVIDLSDPKNPAVAGQVEVPGWSTHIEPVGDLLFAIGFDGGKVAASLFDVADPANPALLKRVQMAGTWGSSEATYDEKALKVLPDDGLVLVPYSSYSADGTSSRYVQLLDLDIAGRDLRLRGQIAHNFEPRRATVLAGSLASISQRELVTATITDRDHPAILADLLLAWPVNRLVDSGDYLIEIADGGSWTGEAPAARVAPASDPDSVLEEVGLGEGTVRDAALRGDKLYVLRQTPADQNFRYWGPVPLLAATGAAQGPSGNATNQAAADQPAVSLDIYDASALPKLVLLGSVSSPLAGGQTYDVGSLLWSSPTSPVVVVQPQSWPRFNWWPPVPIDSVAVTPSVSATKSSVPAASSAASACMIWRPPTRTPAPAVAIVFQTAQPTAPAVQSRATLTAAGNTAANAATAGAGLLVFGYGGKEEILDGGTYSRCRHSLRILDLQDPSHPALRPPIDLPGRLFAVTDLTRDGFLVWTESFAPGTSGKKLAAGIRQVEVSACDGTDVFQVASLGLSGFGPFAADGRVLFSAQGHAVNRFALDGAGVLAASGSVGLDWAPGSLRTIPGGLLGSDWNHLFRATWSDSPDGVVSDWQTVNSADVQNVVPLGNGSVLVPAGDYGVDRLVP